MLQGGKYGRIRLDGIRKFVKDQDSPLASNRLGDCIPGVRPVAENRRLGGFEAQYGGVKLPALQGSRLLVRRKKRERNSGLSSPLPQEAGFAYPSPAIEQD